MKANLFPYQRVAVDFIKSKKRNGLFLDIGLGKAVDDNTRIPTPQGERRLGDLQVGDTLFAVDGRETTIEAVYKHMDKNSYRVTLNDGRTFICCDEHLISFYDTFDKRFETHPHLETRALCDLFDVTFYDKHRYAIPNVDVVEYPKQDVPYSPYLYGYYLGMIGEEQSIVTNENNIEYRLNVCHEKTFEKPICTHPYKQKSRRRMIDLQKPNDEELLRIANTYHMNSESVRKAVMEGFFDYQGVVAILKKGRPVYKSRTPNEQVAKWIAHIGRSLGFKMEISEKTDFIPERKRNMTYYYVQYFTHTPIGENQKNKTDFILNANRHKFKQADDYALITNIEPVASRPMTCFTVDHPRALFCINDYIVTHNTLVTLTALYELAMEGKLEGNILIIAPKRIAKMTWAEEIEKWDHTKNMRYTVITGLSKAKKEAIYRDIPNRKAALYSINRELVPSMVEFFEEENIPFPFQTIVIDEAQSFKNPKSKRFHALKKVTDKIDRIIELTGSPAPNGLEDIWSLVYLIDNGMRLGKTISRFREEFYYPGRCKNNVPYEWFLKDHAEEQIHHLIRDVVISMMKSDYLTLPPITHNVIKLKMTTKERAIYDKLKKEKVLEITESLEVAPKNTAVLLGSLLQLSNGAVYANDLERDDKHIVKLHDHKLDALEEIIEGSNKQPILIFAWYKHDVIRITERFKDVEVFGDNPEQLKRWNRGEIPILLAHPSSAGHGLNFQYGGHILVFFVVPQSLELYEQSIGRLYRNGQTKPVIVHYIMMENTVEEKVIRALMEKQNIQQRLIDAVRAEVDTMKP